MKTNGQTTAQVLQASVPNLLVVPKLFDDPPEGYVAWATGEAGLETEVGEETVSGRLIAATGPAWYYGQLLPRIIGGEYEAELGQAEVAGLQTIPELEQFRALLTPDTPLYRAALAKLARLRFEQGDPLYIGVYNSVERYRQTPVTLSCHGSGRYQVGLGLHSVSFKAASHPEAIGKARQVYFSAREAEIEAAKKAAGDLAASSPRLVLDILAALLKEDRLLADSEGTWLAWENGAHGLYGAQGPDWCYLMSCSAEKAAQLAALAYQQAAKAGQEISLPVRVAGEVPRYLGLSGWQRTETGLDWSGGRWRPLKGETDRGVVLIEETPRFAAGVTELTGNERYTWLGRVQNSKNETLLESPAPAGWELTRDDVLAWAIYAGLKIESRQKKEAGG